MYSPAPDSWTDLIEWALNSDAPLIERFHAAFKWLHKHPGLYCLENDNCAFPDQVEVEVVKVDPETDKINDDAPERNTKVQFWFEVGPYEVVEGIDFPVPTIDVELLCGGDTYEETVLELARLVRVSYGDYEKSSDDVFEEWYDSCPIRRMESEKMCRGLKACLDQECGVPGFEWDVNKCPICPHWIDDNSPKVSFEEGVDDGEEE